MWLTDGSPHNWLGGSDKQCIHIVQDDATGKLVGLFMTQNECFFGYAEALKMAIETYGIPESLISDRARVFYNCKKQKDFTSIEDQLKGITEAKTQMAYILEKRLGIKMIPTFTPEAKGRVERIGGTLQKRLPFLFMMGKIKDIDSANVFLKKYIEKYNAEFAVEAKDGNSAYIPAAPEDDLTMLFSIRHNRKTDSEGVFSFHNYKFKVLGEYKDIRLKKIRLYLNITYGIRAKINGKFYHVELTQLDKNKKAFGKQRLAISHVLNDLFERYLFFDAKKDSLYHIAAG